jgi:hypothetical protein
LALEPPPPAPTSPGDAGVGAAFSQGDLPVAVPGITWAPPSLAVTGTAAFAVVVGTGFLLELDADEWLLDEQAPRTSAPAHSPTAMAAKLVRSRMNAPHESRTRPS